MFSIHTVISSGSKPVGNICFVLYCVWPQVLQWSDNQLLPLLEQQLDPSLYQPVFDAAAAAAAVSPAAAGSSAAAVPDAAQIEAVTTLLPGLLYTTSNICSGAEQHKAAIMNSRVPQLLLQFIRLGAQLAPPAVAAAGPSSRGTSRNPAAAARSGGSAVDASAAAAGAEAAAAATAAGEGGEGVPSASWVACKLALPAVWCVINLLWCAEDGPTAAAGAGNVRGRAGQPQRPASGSSPAATGAGGGRVGGSSGRAATPAAAAGGGGGAGGSSSQAGGDVAMAAADGGVRGEVVQRAAALRGLGFEEALQGLLAVQREGAAAAAAGGEVEGVAGQREGSPAAAVGGVGGGHNAQDLIERVQTALEQLRTG